MNFRVLSVAQGEAITTALWYDDRKPGLADDFLAKLQQAYGSICSNPLGLPLLENYAGSHEVRCCLLHQFPYAVIFVCRNAAQESVSPMTNQSKRPDPFDVM